MKVKLDSNNLDQLISLLGTQADTQLAQQFGCLPWKVAAMRKERNIPAFRRIRESSPFVPPDNIKQLLKTLRNSELVSTCGIPNTAIAYLRQLHKIPQPASTAELHRRKRRNEIDRLLERGISRQEIRKKTGVTFNGLRHILRQEVSTAVEDQSWPVKCAAALQAHGFRSKKEVLRVFAFDPSYFLCITHIGRVAIAEIAAWLGKPAPNHVTLKAVQWWPVRRIDREYRHIAAPDEPLRRAQPLSWRLLNVETGAVVDVLITATGCKRAT